MTSHSENEALNAITYNMTGHFVEFVQSFWSKTDHFTANFGVNTVDHVFEMELYIILSILEKFEHWNRTVLISG